MSIAALALPALLAAQPEPAATPQPTRMQRALVIGNAAFLDQIKPVTTAGALWQVSVARSTIVTDEWGRPRHLPPRTYLHMALTGGVAFDAPGAARRVSGSAYGQLGLVRRTDTFFSSIGGAVQGIATPRAWGPALRVEIMDNIGLQVGAVGIRGRGEAFFASIDYFRVLCEDLGFGWLC